MDAVSLLKAYVSCHVVIFIPCLAFHPFQFALVTSATLYLTLHLKIYQLSQLISDSLLFIERRSSR